jgi:hypothetical protein
MTQNADDAGLNIIELRLQTGLLHNISLLSSYALSRQFVHVVLPTVFSEI